MTPTRDDTRQTLRERPFDVLVIGAGITGAGIALDAAARGLSVAVLDKGDVASGTSGWSTKLVHGGVRYLEQYDFPMVREGLRERYTLLKNAPYLVHRLSFLYPVDGGPFAKLFVDAGLWLYDLLAGRRSLGLHHRLDAAASAAGAPLRAPWDRGGFLYYDGQTDDTRLTLTTLLSAVARGAVVATYTEVVGFSKEGGRISEARARDVLAAENGGGGAEFPIRARAVINATGVWMDRVQLLDDPAVATRVAPSKGAHIVVPAARLPVKGAVIMPRTSDGRVLFAVPWQGRVVVGTTDAAYAGDIDRPTAGADEVAYILRHANAYFGTGLTEDDIVATYAGLRPLIRAVNGGVSGGQDPGGQDKPGGREGAVSTKDVSRKHIVVTSPSGLVSVGGGKLTTYRVMAEDAVEAALAATGLAAPHRANTANIPLAGTQGYTKLRARADELAARYGVGLDVVRHLLDRYGANTTGVLDLIAERPALAAPLAPGLAYVQAEAIYSARHELVTTLEDILARRTRLLLLDTAHGTGVAEAVAQLVAPELGWDEGRIAAEVARYRDYARLAASGYTHSKQAAGERVAAAAV